LTRLWYDMDEVEKFHPVVESALKRAVIEEGYDNELLVKHHLRIPGSGEPDFVLLLKPTERPVFVLEVKRTKGDCDSHRFWSQTREYVETLSPLWAPSYQKYSAITNVERLILFCQRDGPVWGCASAGNPFVDTGFDPPAPDNADKAFSHFLAALRKIVRLVMQKERPNWADTWSLIVDSFATNYSSIRGFLRLDNEIQERDVTSYELLRVVLYDYLKTLYDLRQSPNSQVFQVLPADIFPPTRFAKMLLNNYRRVLGLDFEQVFKDHPDQTIRLLPEKADITIMSHLNDFIKSVNRNAEEAIKENSLPSYFIRLINDKVYHREEMHREGKITTDDGLAAILAELCIETPNAKIMDVGTGIGALSCAAYDKVKELSESKGIQKSHNQILSQIFGIEKDPFLNQLATFQLIAKDCLSVDTSTRVNLEIGDTFENPRPGQFDVVLMNPPFLRHDNKVVPITDEMEKHMLTAIEDQPGLDSFVRKASQPNLYFYFLNWAPHYLKTYGLAGIILMAKFLNNVDGEHVKEFILNDLESVILYPREYFKEFKSTTCVITLRKGSTRTRVSFLRIKNSSLLEKAEKIKSILCANTDITTGDFTLRQVPKNLLDPCENWLIYLTDPENRRGFLDGLEILVPLRELFSGRAERGRAGNSGGSDTVFLRSVDNPLAGYVNTIETQFILPGLRWNKVGNGRRHFILREQDIFDQEALGVPSNYDERTQTGLSAEYQRYPGLKQYYAEAEKEYGNGWKRIVNDICNSEVSPDLIIPRADREKHTVYCLTGRNVLIISTNFFYLKGFRADVNNVSKQQLIKCICGYLMSSFGQIQFELKANNQEGCRKLEGFMIEDFKCFDVRRLHPREIERVARAFEEFDALNQDVKGDEGVYTLRRELDEAVGGVIFSRNNGGFGSVGELVDRFELFLEELVKMREI